jgi:hypothetical protein
LEHVLIHDTGNGCLREKKGPDSFFADGAKHVHLWAVTNMFQEATWIFAVPDPTGVGLATVMKRAPITENYGDRKSLIVLYSVKHLHIEFIANHLICIRKVLNDG